MQQQLPKADHSHRVQSLKRMANFCASLLILQQPLEWSHSDRHLVSFPGSYPQTSPQLAKNRKSGQHWDIAGTQRTSKLRLRRQPYDLERTIAVSQVQLWTEFSTIHDGFDLKLSGFLPHGAQELLSCGATTSLEIKGVAINVESPVSPSRRTS